MWRDLRWYLDIYIVISVMTKVATDILAVCKKKSKKTADSISCSVIVMVYTNWEPLF